jgi:DNA mismatch endonuclease (patch repair protein)
MDKVSKKVRSEIMRKVRSSNNKSTERRFRARLIQLGLRGWKVRPNFKFSPDFIFEKEKIAIFIDGCFWHGCPICKKYPLSNMKYWDKKINRNMNRDKKANKELTEQGWKVLRFWEHELKENINICLMKLHETLLVKKF